MARKHRLEFPGAIYHVINRGNYRTWVFKDDGAKGSFQSCVFAACERFGWVLNAHVVMGNHYHLALETPDGNLVAGMQWLQASFANRFNRLRKEHGHLFQGRYKALVVEPGVALGQVCHYIHLNPVRAGLGPVERLADYRFGSYRLLARPRERPSFLRITAALDSAGGLADTAAGRRCYADFLAWQVAHGPAGKSKAYESMSRGWAIGSREFKKELLQEHKLAAASREWDVQGAREIRETRWQQALDRAIGLLPTAAMKSTRKSAPWKVAVATHLKKTADIANGWLAEKLDMGSGAYLSKHVGLGRARPGEHRQWIEQLARKHPGPHSGRNNS